ncbi:MAG: 7-cyano-7-deazaguanine synthase QueC [Novosphingopyxis baekryungensis]|jgi:7-cyano-7-deazaguanine synthase|nr:7-cyano-7-deazaguanine synthase QueC [Novosphingopyxis baekryungensis]
MSEHGKKAVVLLSGGLDSMVAGGIAREQGFDILALTIDYNQRHRVELESAARIAKELGALRHVVLPLDLTQFGGSALTADIDVPKDGAGTREDGGVPITYVPARNTIFLSLCLGWAEAAGARDMVIGVNALDYSGYPDCRPEFIDAFQKLALLGTKAGDAKESFEVRAPLQYMTKARIAEEAMRLGLDPAMSWSCYDPTADGKHCGECDSCRLRHGGFVEAGIADPTVYAVTPDVA